MSDQGQKAYRYTRWVTEFDGGKPIRAYSQFSDELDGPWLGGRFNTDMCLCGHERRQHAEAGFQGCGVCECVSFAYAIAGLRPPGETGVSPAPIPEPMCPYCARASDRTEAS